MQSTPSSISPTAVPTAPPQPQIVSTPRMLPLEEEKKLPISPILPESSQITPKESNICKENIKNEFEEYKKKDEALGLAELSFETGEQPAEPERIVHPQVAVSGPIVEQPQSKQPTELLPAEVQLNALFENMSSVVMREKRAIKEKYQRQSERENEFAKMRTERVNEIEKEREEWEKHKLACISPEKSGIIDLEIGGTHKIATNRTTLTKYHSSLLAMMFSGLQPLTLHHGKVFIDRDGEPFKMMIDYLRSGKMPASSTKEQEQRFKEELEFWGIPLTPIRKKSYR